MKKFLSTLTLSALVAITIVSCQKDESATPLNGQPSGAKKDKVTICHKENGHALTLYVPEEALGGHLGHGDSIGECGAIVTPE